MDTSGGATDENEIGVSALLREQKPKLMAILSRFRIPPADAEDLLQNALYQFVHKRKQIRSPGAWLRGAVRNECRMYWRSRSRSFTVAVDTAVLDAIAEGSRPKQELAVLRRNLDRWISELDQRCQSILHLRYHLGYKPREVAEKTGYAPSSIDKVTRRCLDALGRKLAAALPPGWRPP